MHFSSAALALLALPLAFTHPTELESRAYCEPVNPAAFVEVKNAFISSGLVPTYVNSFNPTLLANITYTLATGGTKSVNLGNSFNSTETLLQPTVYLTQEYGQPYGTQYSLFFINFDNPNPHLPPSAHLPFLHWQQAGLIACGASSGSTVELFISSVPPSVAPDRYTFLVYRQPAGYVSNPVTTASRVILDINEYAASQGLTLVGGNFFLEGQANNIPS